jgi:hypothetical protein
VLVSDVIHVTVDPVCILVPVRAFHLVVTQSLLMTVLVVAVAIVDIVSEPVWVMRLMVMIVCKGWQDDTTQGKEWEKLLFGDEVVSE